MHSKLGPSGPHRRGLLAVTLALAISAPTFAVEILRSTLDSGGGRSAGGAFTLDGSIGQPDAGTMTGGDLTLSGGFWAGGSAATALPEESTPRFSRLEDPVPNPFNPRTLISFELAEPGPVTVRVYDVTGRRLRTLAEGALPAGSHELSWNGRDDLGDELASGVYFIQMRAGRYAGVRKAVLVR